MRRKLNDKVLLLSGCGMAPHEIADALRCQSAYVRATLQRHKKKTQRVQAEIAFLREANKILEATKPLELR